MRLIKYILLLLITQSFVNEIIAQNKKEEFKIFGQIFHKEITVKDVSITVSLKDSIIYQGISNFNGRFKFKLLNGYSYKINFSKNKYITKTLSVNAFADDSTEIKPFAFDVELVQQRDFRYVDVPEDLGKVAHLYYDEEKETLSWDKQFTQKAHETIKNLQELNKAKRYEKYSRF